MQGTHTLLIEVAHLAVHHFAGRWTSARFGWCRGQLWWSSPGTGALRPNAYKVVSELSRAALFPVWARFRVGWLPPDVGGFRLVLAREWHARLTQNYRRTCRFLHRLPCTPTAQSIGVNTPQWRTRDARSRCPSTSTMSTPSTGAARPQRLTVTAANCQSESPAAHLFTENWVLHTSRGVSARLLQDHRYLLDAATCH